VTDERRDVRFGGMPLFMKYLTPFLVLMLAAGFLGAFLIPGGDPP
jgi:hypothetical protein